MTYRQQRHDKTRYNQVNLYTFRLF